MWGCTTYFPVLLIHLLFLSFFFLSFFLHPFSLPLCLCCSLSHSEHASQREWISQHRQRPRGRRGGRDLLYPVSVSTSPSLIHTTSPPSIPQLSQSPSVSPKDGPPSCISPILALDYYPWYVCGSACFCPSLISQNQTSVSSSAQRFGRINALTLVRGEQSKSGLSSYSKLIKFWKGGLLKRQLNRCAVPRGGLFHFHSQ